MHQVPDETAAQETLCISYEDGLRHAYARSMHRSYFFMNTRGPTAHQSVPSAGTADRATMLASFLQTKYRKEKGLSSFSLSVSADQGKPTKDPRDQVSAWVLAHCLPAPSSLSAFRTCQCRLLWVFSKYILPENVRFIHNSFCFHFPCGIVSRCTYTACST